MGPTRPRVRHGGCSRCDIAPSEEGTTLTPPTAPTTEFETELTARATEWNRLASELDERASLWSRHAARWPRRGDARRSIAGDRATWIAEQTRQLASWLRMAADHLRALAALAPEDRSPRIR